jgi:tripartite motif-containing protein 71
MSGVALLVGSTPGATAAEVFTGTVTAGGANWRAHFVTVSQPSTITASLDWSDPSANLDLLLFDPNGTFVKGTGGSTAKPEQIVRLASTTGSWKLGVKAISGSASYTLNVDVTPAPAGSVTHAGTFGYSGPAGLYAYGMTWDPTNNTVIVGDYWNYRVHRFSATGTRLGQVSKTAPRDQPGGICVPYGVEADPDGNIWVADQNCSRVVAFDKNGNWVRTIGRGGTPNYGFGCGGGKMNVPTHVVVDPVSRRVYVADPKCGGVSVYSSTGTYLFAFDWTGSGISKPQTEGMDIGPDGLIYAYEQNTRRIVVFNKSGQWVRNFAPKSDLNDVRGVAIDPTNNLLYAVGAYHNRVYQYRLDGTFLKQWGGSGTTEFDSVRYVAADDAGNIWVSDTWGYRVWKFDKNGDPLPWATGPQPPPNGGYNFQNGVTVSPDGRLFVVDTYEQRMQTFDTSQQCVSMASCPAFLSAFGYRGENYTAHPEAFTYPKSVDFGNGSVWMGDGGNAILQFLPDGTFVQRIGSRGTSPGHFIAGVFGLEFASGQIYATDVGNCRLQIFDQSGGLVSYMGSCGTASNQMRAPLGLTVRGDTVYVVESQGNQLSVWNTATKTLTARLRPTCGGTGLKGPTDVQLSPSGDQLWVTDTGNQRVVRMNIDGTGCQVAITGATVPGGTLGNTRYLDFGPDGRLYVSTGARRVFAFTIG